MNFRLSSGLLALSIAGCSAASDPTPAAPPAPSAPSAPPAPTAPAPAASTAPLTAASAAPQGDMSNDPEVDRKLRTRVTAAAMRPMEKLHVCYRDAIRRDGKAGGLVSIKLTVAPSGEAVVIDDAGSTVRDGDFITCIRATLSKVSYPRWKGKAVTVVVAYDFSRPIDVSPPAEPAD